MFKIVVALLFLAVGSLCDFTDSMKILPTYEQETPDQQFARADANSDGKLDKCEFPNKDIWFVQSNDQQFQEFDTNADGFVSKDEQNAYYKKQEDEALRWRLENFNNTLQEFDTNGNGLLEQDELTALLKTRYYLTPRAKFAHIFSKFDTNGDKGLNIDELEQFENNLPWEDFDPIEQEQVFEPMVIDQIKIK